MATNVNKYNRSGFTLAEALMAIVILSIVAAGVIVPFSAGAAVQVEGWRRSEGAELAGALMEQIKATPYDSVSSTWSGYSEAQGQVKDSLGTVISDVSYADMSRDVTITEATLGYTLHYWVTVRVYYEGNEIAEVSSLIGP